MKRNLFKTSLLALAGTALAFQAAHAQISVSQGDLILGVEELNSSGAAVGNDYEVDLGNITKFTTTSSVDLSSIVLSSDLSSSTGFGSGFASGTSLTNGASTLDFGVVGYIPSGTAGTAITAYNGTLNKGAVFWTQVSAPNAESSSGLGAEHGDIGTLVGDISGVNATTTNGKAFFTPVSDTSSFSMDETSGGNTFFGSGSGAGNGNNSGVADFGGTAGSPLSPSISLYLNNAGASGGAAGSVLDLGTFTFKNGNDLVYNGVNYTTPEPSTYALMAVGLGLLFFWQKRRNSINS